MAEDEQVEIPQTPPEPADDTAKRDLVAEGDVAADYLEALLDIADLDGDIDIDVEDDRASLSVIEVNDGELAALVGTDGEVLAALQDLTRLAVAREMGERSRLMVDVAGFRARRRETLQQLAAEAVEKVRESSAPVRLERMSAFERKVVHDVVTEAGLHSESEGTDPARYVVISPA
ncbi:MAG: R3H domain-containing nucleic acid-binding protein [Candidatus Nanopelagicales bacterium]|nr:R3H domain-containing nucleic acid-binding protein [Candidatus Nanopelagicales bacterium]